MAKNKIIEKPKNTPVSFLLKKGDTFYMIPDSLVETLSIDEAYKLGVIAHLEQRKQLLEDALGGDHFIEGHKVVESLEASLSKLEQLFPNLRNQIKEIDEGYHFRVGRS